MANAQIRFTQGATVGTAGMALLGVTGTAVTVSNGDDSNVVRWTFTVNDVPPTSTVPIGVAQTGSTPSWSFTPDVVDCYSITLETEDNLGVIRSDTRVFGVRRTSGRIVPPFNGDASSLNFQNGPWPSQILGWDPALRDWLEFLDSIGGTSDHAVVAVAGLTVLSRPSGGSLYVPVNLTQAAGDVTIKAWGGSAIGDRISIADEAFGAGKSFGSPGAHDLTFDGNGIPVVQWGSQGPPTFGSTTALFRFAGDVVVIRKTQLTSVNSGNPFWFPLQGQ